MNDPSSHCPNAMSAGSEPDAANTVKVDRSLHSAAASQVGAPEPSVEKTEGFAGGPRLWRVGPEIVETISSLDFPNEPISFRESPQLVICDHAQNAPEAILLKQMSLFYGQVLEYMRLADKCVDPGARLRFIEFAMALSGQCLKIHDGIQKGRRNGHQEVVVKHQEVKQATGRRARPARSHIARPLHEGAAKSVEVA